MKTTNYDTLNSYIMMALNSIEGGYIDRGSKINFRCNVCGDSKTRLKLKRGWILKNKEPWMYHCFNCNCSLPAEHWLKLYFPYYYNEYIKDSYKIDLGFNKPKTVVKEEVKEPEYNEFEDVRYFVSLNCLSDNSLITEAQKYCASRLIPQNIYHKWFVATSGKFKSRLIIPFYDQNNKIYNYQARLFNKEADEFHPKYINRVNAKNNIYNYFNVRVHEPVIILEGMIDSLFVENSVAMTGLKVTDEKLKRFGYKYFLLDNDKSGIDTSMALLIEGHYVFMWKKFLKDMKQPLDIKDVNDYVRHLNNFGCYVPGKYSFDFLKPYFTNSLFERIELL
jgi:hypothetical protein